MKYIKLALISLIAFASVITLVSLFFPSRIRVSRAIDIHANEDSLKKLMTDPSRWASWYPGMDTLPPIILLKKTIGYRLNEQGAMLRLTGRTDSTITIHASGPGVKDMSSGWNIFPSGIPGTYTVQWYSDFRLKWYPWEKFSSVLLDKNYGPAMEKGLEKLKAAAER